LIDISSLASGIDFAKQKLESVASKKLLLRVTSAVDCSQV